MPDDRRPLWADHSDDDHREWLRDGEEPTRVGPAGSHGGAPSSPDDHDGPAIPPPPAHTPPLPTSASRPRTEPPTATHDGAPTRPHDRPPIRAASPQPRSAATSTRPAPPRDRPTPPSGSRRGVALLAAVAIAAVASTVTLLVTGGDDGAGDSVRTVQVSVVGGDSPDAPLKAAYTAAVDGVVQIRTSSGAGTGFVYDDEGTIVTNAHVVGNATSVRVRFGDSTSMIDGRVLGRDASTDLAVVRVDPSEVDKLAPLPLADSDEAETGDQVLAIGYPLGLDQTATGGIVSGVGRSIQAPNGFNIDKVIQTDAPINPGNSGGPLLDVKGRVIGVNSQIATTGRSGGNVGIGYAVPSNTAKDIVPRLAQGQTVERGYMGVSIGPLGSSSAGSGSGGQGGGTSGEGAEVVTVTPNGPAADAGLRGARGSRGGDVIRRIEGEVVKGPDDVTRIVSGRRPGDTVRFEIERDGRRQEVRVRLAKRPDNLPGTTTTVP